VGADLARAVPALAGIPSNTPLAPAPLPGGTRVFYAAELQSVAARFSLILESPAEACFRYATEALDKDRVSEAMRLALRLPDARIELVETSTGPVPVGQIEFKTEKLASPAGQDPNTPVIWRGNVVYAGGRQFPIWARVRITAPVGRIVAAEPLKPGAVIKPEQLRSEIVKGFPQVAGSSLAVDQIAGMIAVRSVAAGAEVHLDNLTRPNDVNRGDLVHVEVQFGAAHLALTGRAESAGRIGDVVSVRNPESSKVFRALVQGRNRVVVEPNVSERN
jgi:flagella basal body P-ring formation protein FlgA